MKIMPVIKCSDLERSLRFYTGVLEFQRRWPGHEAQEHASGVADLVWEEAEVQLSRHAGDGCFGSSIRLWVEDVAAYCERCRARGLDTTRYPESPVHTAPVDQTWGLREFCVRDPDGNNFCFCQFIG